MKLLKALVYRLRGEYSTARLVRMGMQVGSHFSRMHGTILDPSHCWLIEIGSHVTMAPRVHVLCHDASTKAYLGYTKIGRVTIGDYVFIGADSVILPGVRIGSNVIIGANSTVTRDIPDNSVAVGNPARVICTLDAYLEKEKARMETAPCYDRRYTLRGKITKQMRQKQKQELTQQIGYVE